MTPDELRALADALRPMAKAPCFDGIDIERAADYLRAQADAQPVPAVPPLPAKWTERHTSAQAWIEDADQAHDLRLYVSGIMESHDQRIAYAQEIARRLNAAPTVPAGWKLVPVEPMPEMLSAVGMMDGYDWHAPGCSPDADHATWYSAMIAAAPAAPQGAMLDSHRRLVEQAIQSAEHPSGMSTHDGKAHIDASVLRRMLAIIDSSPAAPQAEPIDPHMIAAEDRFPDVPAEQWVTCSQCDGDFDRECPICDGLGKVLATDGEQAEPKPTPASGDDLSVYKEMADSYRNDEPTGAPYGIIDPDYGRVYTIARKLAWEEGYAIGLHGSFTRDLDLIAVPWTDTACEPEHLIRRIVDATGLKLRDGVAVKPHGRRAWTLLFPAFGDPRFVDLSVMPRIGGSDAE